MIDISGFEGYIFDLDNTLLDSHSVWHDVDIKFFEKRNIVEPEDYARKVATMNLDAAAAYTIERFGLNEKAEDITTEWFSMIEKEYAYNLKMFDGVAELLKRIHDGGGKLALATATAHKLFAPALIRNGVYDWFDAFATIDETGRGKDYSDVYYLAAERMGIIPQRCVVFEDIAIGVQSAKRAGMTTVAFLNSNAKKEWDFLKATADYTFTNYRDITYCVVNN